MRVLLVVLGLMLAYAWGADSGLAWSTIGIGVALAVLALVVRAAGSSVVRLVRAAQLRRGHSIVVLAGWRRFAALSAGFCLAMVPSVAIGATLYVRHQDGCRAPRADAAVDRLAEQQAQQSALASTKTLTASDQLAPLLHQEAALGLTYGAVVVGNASCFSADAVSQARDDLRAYTRPADTDITPNLYCWDEGSPRPHHLGHPAMGDHQCTYGELRGIGLFR